MTDSMMLQKKEEEYDLEEEQFYNIVSARLHDSDKKNPIAKKMKNFKVSLSLNWFKNGQRKSREDIRVKLI